MIPSARYAQPKNKQKKKKKKSVVVLVIRLTWFGKTKNQNLKPETTNHKPIQKTKINEKPNQQKTNTTPTPKTTTKPNPERTNQWFCFGHSFGLIWFGKPNLSTAHTTLPSFKTSLTIDLLADVNRICFFD
jgi:hypothetical protein